MRQVLLNGSGALLARMPRPVTTARHVLVRTEFSLISVGTEVAGLLGNTANTSSAERMDRVVDLAVKAAHDPRKAVRKIATLVRGQVRSLRPQPSRAGQSISDLQWVPAGGARLERRGDELVLHTDNTSGYQLLSRRIAVPHGSVPILRVRGRLTGGSLHAGLLDGDGERWLGTATFQPGLVHEALAFDTDATEVQVVLSNAGEGRAELVAEDITVDLILRGQVEPDDMQDQGWNVGYSCVGIIVALGEGVDDLSVGDRVACAGAGKANHADYVTIPRNLVCRVPEGCTPTAAATSTVGAIALQGVRRTAPQLGERICVLGLGLIGQITVQLLKASGCRVLGMDPDPDRVTRALALGMDEGASTTEDIARLVRDATAGHGADAVVITAASKSDAIANEAMELARRKGRVVLVGDIGLGLERAAFYRKELDLLMSSSYGPGRYDAHYEEEGRDYPFAYVRWTLNRNMQAYLEQVAEGRVRVDQLIDRVADVGDAPALYAELAKPGCDKPVGVVLRYPTADVPVGLAPTSLHLGGHRPPRDGTARWVLVGAGGFGTTMLAPLLFAQSERLFARGVVSRDAVRGGNFARQHRLELHSSDITTVLDDEDTDLLVIATRHHEHAAQVVAGIDAGKHVFVEKPLALTWTELDQVQQAVESADPLPILMVGFNRRFSPAAVRLRNALKDRVGPAVLHYRVNAGYLPPDHWVHSPQGGGRNLGEACHMYDLFRFLVGSPVRSVSATAIRPDGVHRRDDNFAATLTYEDGSLATLIYTAVGPRAGLGKERLEVFADDDAYVLDDYTHLTRASDGTVLWASDTVDKGHAEEIAALAGAIMDGGNPPIPLAELLETSAVALHVQDLLDTGDE